MKRTIKSIVTLVAVVVAGVSCLQLEQPALNEILSGDEIVFGADAYIEAETKASSGTTETTSLTSFYVSAVTGSAGSESSAFNSTQFTQVTGSSPAVYTGGKMWAATDQSWKFYASNVPLTFHADGTTVTATNTTDVVCAYLTDGTYKTKNTLTFEHIFARFGRVDVAAESGYTISNISVRITPKTGGTYNLRTGAGQTDGSGWSSVTTGSATVVANQVGANGNDIYLVPGIYQVTATWTATQSGTSITYTDKVVNVPIVGGKTNVVSVVLGGEITFGVDLAEYCDYDFRDNLDYLTFYCDEAGTIGWACYYPEQACTIQYSKDFGATWTNLTSTSDGVSISVNAGDIVWFKGSNSNYGNGVNRFTLSNKAHVYGNVNSLTGNNTSVSSYCFRGLFLSCTNLYTYDAKKIILPATTLGYECYDSMFSGCINLTTAPDLPAVTLATECYHSMFAGCQNLIAAPSLPAMTLGTSCYYSMFSSCTSLVVAPVLPAKILTNDCYREMFKSCTSLTIAPAIAASTLAERCYYSMFDGCQNLTATPSLPAMTLENNCYAGMFRNCTSLVVAPALPAKTLKGYCYYDMFAGCTSLTIAPVLPATKLAPNCYDSMFAGCTSLTTAPDLPATKLVSGCYGYMFRNCTSLVSAPFLPAKTLVSNCYTYMFRNCSNLNYIKALFTTSPSSSYTLSWVEGVADTGTFVKADDAAWTVSGTNGIPTGWTVYTEATDPRRTIGRFTINAQGDQVGFAPGNLQCTIASGPTNDYNYVGTDWCFANNQWDYVGKTDGANSFTVGKKMDFFGWVGKSASYDTYGLCSNNSTVSAGYYGNSDADGLKTDWGDIPGVISACGDGWFTLSNNDWGYLFNTRTTGKTVNGTPNAKYTAATIRTDATGVNGIILFPDDYSAGTPSGVTWGTINAGSAWGTQCTCAGWASLEAAGCVFLPAAGHRIGVGVAYVGSMGHYWSSSSWGKSQSWRVRFGSGYVRPQDGGDRLGGHSVRLVKRVN